VRRSTIDTARIKIHKSIKAITEKRREIEEENNLLLKLKNWKNQQAIDVFRNANCRHKKK
jgi:hypothetical protein